MSFPAAWTEQIPHFVGDDKALGAANWLHSAALARACLAKRPKANSEQAKSQKRPYPLESCYG